MNRFTIGESPDWTSAARIAAIAAGVAALASPTWLWPGEISVFPAVSLVFTGLVAALVASWGTPTRSWQPNAVFDLPAILAGAAAATLVGLAARSLVDAVLLNPPDPAHGDMLTVIELAGRRFLRGRDPYTTYQVPWQVSLGYGPPLWGAFLVPQLLRIDLRLLTASGQLFVPLCCGAVAVVEMARSRPVSAAAWILLLATMAFDPDLLRFVGVGHTPAYWPLLPLFAILMVGERWYAAAAMLGILVAARATMVVLVPIFVITVWFRDRSRALGSGLVCAAVGAAILLPFFLWDPVPMWRGMVANYGPVVKEVVWRSVDGWGVRTIGLTGWLLSHGLERFVELSQACALAIVYLLAWKAVPRGASALAYMTLALFAFSMTSLWPVYYFHFDVVLLLASAAMAEAVGAMRLRRILIVWPMALACTVAVIALATTMMASPQPSIVVANAAGRRLLRQGFSGLEHDGARGFSWAEATHAVLLLPRSSASAADLMITGEPFVPAGAAPQALTAILNGISLGTVQAASGWQTLRFQAPASAWRIGANQLELFFPPTKSPKELGLSADRRRLAIAIERIDVQAR